MQYLKPILAQEARIEHIHHNDLNELEQKVMEARAAGEVPVYVADGIYSMGGLCPIPELLEMAERLNFYLYLDDAHGTSIIGSRGEGAVLSQIDGYLPDRIFLTFSLTKGFGVAGGGILVSNKTREHLIRCFGQIYAFSAPLDFSSVPACLASLALHRDGTLNGLQKALQARVGLFDQLMGLELPFSPIRMIPVGNEAVAIEMAKRILDLGYFVCVTFFPIVRRGHAQLRICIASNHTEDQIKGLAAAIQDVQREYGVPQTTVGRA